MVLGPPVRERVCLQRAAWGACQATTNVSQIVSPTATPGSIPETAGAISTTESRCRKPLLAVVTIRPTRAAGRSGIWAREPNGPNRVTGGLPATPAPYTPLDVRRRANWLPPSCENRHGVRPPAGVVAKWLVEAFFRGSALPPPADSRRAGNAAPRVGESAGSSAICCGFAPLNRGGVRFRQTAGTVVVAGWKNPAEAKQ